MAATRNISRKKAGTIDSNIYEGFFSVQPDTGTSYYNAYFNDAPEKRLLPMEWDLLRESVDRVLGLPGFSAPALTVVNFGAGNGRELPFYKQLAHDLAQRPDPVALRLVLQDIANAGLDACRDMLAGDGFTVPAPPDGQTVQMEKGLFSVRLIYSETDDSFEHTAELIGPCDIVHSLFGVLCSICDEDLILETLAMLSRLCTGCALFTVAGEGRFPEDLAHYDALRQAGRPAPLLHEPGTISYRSLHRKPDGGVDDFGSERYKLFSFDTLGALSAKGQWRTIKECVVNTAPPMQLSRDWPAAEADRQACRAINDSLALLEGATLQDYRARLSKESMHIGLLCEPVRS